MLKLNEEKLQQFASTVSSIQDKTTRSALNTLLSILEDNIPTLSLTRSGSFLPTLIPYILHPFSEKKLIPPELDFSPEEKMVEASVKSLMTWSEKQRMSVIFDSDISGLKDDSFLESLYNHSRQYVVIESSDGCVFGGYIHRRVRELNVDVEDKKAFLFSFQLDHNYTNIKYELRDEESERGVLCVSLRQ
ncbi:hypothetical protein EIN_223470 [Entamoeba invadens IP1]|uniref:TLDc domain-containing protein n=1 Tax=Entamoeba invadens IP1 TaxID=370355 RepID=A0A0A1U290_ENTIV|nr:hypothetical protein EIN_223470 [Entamoeba invadens IP1]ELP88144.1 hypothetical protein EIN_223470 [Entamoeba invadens IP1]|eukprot:XP_004254915.1 hypothetical protein EIN_223470 [Entamoeba invadens IP1]